MSITTVTHLNFAGQAREALNFYSAVFGGPAIIATYADFGMPPGQPDSDRVVWGQVQADNGFQVMAYDVPTLGQPAEPLPAGSTRRENGLTLTDQRFFVSVRGTTAEEVGSYWAGLADGATVLEAFGPAPWAPAFGMLTDRFGVTWILDVMAS